MNCELLNQVTNQVSELRFMAEITADLADQLRGDPYTEGCFTIDKGTGNQLNFCTNATLDNRTAIAA